MHQYRLREQLVHGDSLRPFHLYRLGSQRGSVFPCHWHPEWELLYVRRGVLELVRDQGTTCLRAGEAALLGATELHAATSPTAELDIGAFVFHPNLLRSPEPDATTPWVDGLDGGRLAVPGVLEASSAPAQDVRRLLEVVEGRGGGWEAAVRGRLFLVLADLVAEGRLREVSPRAEADPSHGLRSALQYIEDELGSALSVDDLAARANLSTSHFTRLFRALTGETPLRHVIRRRIDEADRLLRLGQGTVSEIALQVGFSNFSHFSRTFRSLRGVAPSQVRRQTQGRQTTRGAT